MLNHIEKLLEATKNLKVSYRLGYASGTPDIGVRGYNLHHRVEGICYQGCTDDMIVIDGVGWLVYGDIYKMQSNTDMKPNARVHDLRAVHELRLDTLRVHVQAQASVAGTVVTVELGTRRVCGRYALQNGEGVLVLE